MMADTRKQEVGRRETKHLTFERFSMGGDVGMWDYNVCDPIVGPAAG